MNNDGSVINLKPRKPQSDSGEADAMPQKPPQQAAPSTSAVSSPGSEGKTLLIVEDDSFMRGLLTTRLRQIGYGVIDAMDAETGLKYLGMKRTDLILLDLMLPGINGFEFLVEKKKRGHEGIKTIVLSNLGRQEDIDHAFDLGAVDYLVKANFTLDGIAEKVQEHIIT